MMIPMCKPQSYFSLTRSTLLNRLYPVNLVKLLLRLYGKSTNQDSSITDMCLDKLYSIFEKDLDDLNSKIENMYAN